MRKVLFNYKMEVIRTRIKLVRIPLMEAMVIKPRGKTVGEPLSNGATALRVYRTHKLGAFPGRGDSKSGSSCCGKWQLCLALKQQLPSAVDVGWKTARNGF